MLHEFWIPAYAGMTTFYEAVIVDNRNICIEHDMAKPEWLMFGYIRE